jgi:hypothetical protein
MIKLSDYLDYLNSEIIQARKKADENAVKVAKEYAQHEYLKYFKVPRFSMATIKMDIPLKITDIDSETKYDFILNRHQFVNEVNSRIETVNGEKNLKIPKLELTDIKEREFNNLFRRVETRDLRYTRDLTFEVMKANINKTVSDFLQNTFFQLHNITSDSLKYELNKIVTDVLVSKHVPVSTKLNDLYIDPDTTKATEKDKLLVNLHVEMIEEAIRIVRLTDANGKEIEEITFE